MNALNNNKIVEVTYDNVFGIPSGDVKIDTEAFAYDGGTKSKAERILTD